MALPKDLHARRYYRAGILRLEEAAQILARLELAHAAVYLSGYAIECTLKALIMETTPVSKRAEMLISLKQDFGHNLELLRAGLIRSGARPPRDVNSEFRFVNTWSSEMRYDPKDWRMEDAERFLSAARVIVMWVKRRI